MKYIKEHFKEEKKQDTWKKPQDGKGNSLTAIG
jgi:hypothetical protein